MTGLYRQLALASGRPSVCLREPPTGKKHVGLHHTHFMYTKVGIYWFTSVRSVFLSRSVNLCVPFISVQRFLSCRWSNTRHWPNGELMLAHRLRRWAIIIPVLGYRVVFSATLNVGQRHRQWANINPVLVQSIMPYRQHASTSSMKYWLGLNGCWQAPATLAQHWTDFGIGVGLYSPPSVSTTKEVI